MYGNIFIVGFRGQDKVRQNECSGGNDHSLFNKDLFWIQRIKTYIFAYECVTRGFDFSPPHLHKRGLIPTEFMGRC